MGQWPVSSGSLKLEMQPRHLHHSMGLAGMCL
jgi:hypothetical protein